MERITFLIEDSGEQLSCMLNPERVLLRRSSGLVRQRSLGAELDGARDDLVLRTGGGNTEVELDLLFDLSLGPVDAAAPTQDVRELTAALWRLTERSESGCRAATARLIWGRCWNMRVVVDALAERLEEFSPVGAARRSWLRVRLLRIEEEAPRSLEDVQDELPAVEADAALGAAAEELAAHDLGAPGDGYVEVVGIDALQERAALDSGLCELVAVLQREAHGDAALQETEPLHETEAEESGLEAAEGEAGVDEPGASEPGGDGSSVDALAASGGAATAAGGADAMGASAGGEPAGVLSAPPAGSGVAGQGAAERGEAADAAAGRALGAAPAPGTATPPARNASRDGEDAASSTNAASVDIAMTLRFAEPRALASCVLVVIGQAYAEEGLLSPASRPGAAPEPPAPAATAAPAELEGASAAAPPARVEATAPAPQPSSAAPAGGGASRVASERVATPPAVPTAPAAAARVASTTAAAHPAAAPVVRAQATASPAVFPAAAPPANTPAAPTRVPPTPPERASGRREPRQPPTSSVAPPPVAVTSTPAATMPLPASRVAVPASVAPTAEAARASVSSAPRRAAAAPASPAIAAQVVPEPATAPAVPKAPAEPAGPAAPGRGASAPAAPSELVLPSITGPVTSAGRAAPAARSSPARSSAGGAPVRRRIIAAERELWETLRRYAERLEHLAADNVESARLSLQRALRAARRLGSDNLSVLDTWVAALCATEDATDSERPDRELDELRHTASRLWADGHRERARRLAACLTQLERCEQQLRAALGALEDDPTLVLWRDAWHALSAPGSRAASGAPLPAALETRPDVAVYKLARLDGELPHALRARIQVLLSGDASSEAYRCARAEACELSRHEYERRLRSRRRSLFDPRTLDAARLRTRRLDLVAQQRFGNAGEWRRLAQARAGSEREPT